MGADSARISVWVTPGSVAISNPRYGTLATDPSDNTKNRYLDMGEPYCGRTTNIRFVLGGEVCTTTNILSAGTWTYVVIAYNGTQSGAVNQVTIYSNAAVQTESSAGSIRSTMNIIDLHHQIGTFNTRYFNGRIDELRLSSSIPSPAWIATEYRNQSAPSAFFSVGASVGGRSPTIRNLSPSSTVAGTAGFHPTAHGTNYVSCAPAPADGNTLS